MSEMRRSRAFSESSASSSNSSNEGNSKSEKEDANVVIQQEGVEEEQPPAWVRYLPKLSKFVKDHSNIIDSNQDKSVHISLKSEQHPVATSRSSKKRTRGDSMEIDSHSTEETKLKRKTHDRVEEVAEVSQGSISLFAVEDCNVATIDRVQFDSSSKKMLKTANIHETEALLDMFNMDKKS